MTGIYPTAPDGQMADPVVLIDPDTGLPYVAGGSDDAASETTLTRIALDLETPVIDLPPTRLMAPGDFEGSTLIDFNTSGEHALTAPGGAGVKRRIYKIHFTCAAAITVEFYDALVSETGPVLVDGFIAGGAGDGIDLVLDGRSHLTSQANKSLVMKLSASGVRVLGRCFWKGSAN